MERLWFWTQLSKVLEFRFLFRGEVEISIGKLPAPPPNEPPSRRGLEHADNRSREENGGRNTRVFRPDFSRSNKTVD
ncbi:hypothetical protein [Methylosinus sp. PW1]|uniref:hypothetical protein n=1 Tax=Methylosinus sp. PW1 TaxID=107636 RepID=UPI0018DE0301|nr:hypothetical protein [Methylosinus sp. PW1]